VILLPTPIQITLHYRNVSIFSDPLGFISPTTVLVMSLSALGKNMAAMSADPDDLPIANGIRRSGRPKKAPLKYDEEYIAPPVETPSQPKTNSRVDRPKRRSAEAAYEQIVSEEVDVLQEHIFARMDTNERKEYQGWVELESEPVSMQPSDMLIDQSNH
jgi:hypothetical protein